MNELLSGLKADLTSRRMLPLVAFAALVLVGALAYVALAGKPEAATSHTSSSAVANIPPLEGPSVSVAPANPNAALAETTAGVSYQHGGKTRNPFQPLPGSGTSSESGSPETSGSSSSGGGSQGGSAGESGGSSSSGGSSGSGGSAGGSGGSGGSSGSGGSTGSGGSGGSSKSGGSVGDYHIDVQLQRLSESGQPIGEPQVFKDVIDQQPLPSKHKALVAPEGVTGGGKGVAFVLLKEAIMHGSGRCVPSAADCAAIALKLHASEELQYLQSDGTVTYYKLTVTKIEKIGAGASAASVRSVSGSAAGKALIAHMHLTVPSAADFGGQLGTIVGPSHR